MKYNRVLIYSKKGNLMDYLCTDKVACRFSNVEKAKEMYGREREIQLIARLRWEEFPVSTRKGIVQIPKCFCEIKCPVNPLPVKGEFELPSVECLRSFLKANGWVLKHEFCSDMFE